MIIKSWIQGSSSVLMFALPTSRAQAQVAQAVSLTGGTETRPLKVRYPGIDVSHYQGVIDWAKVKNAGLKFAFTKATQGKSEVDPTFHTNWAEIKTAGLVRGAYHFFNPDIDAAAQADHFIATVQLEPGDLPPVLDIEVTDGVTQAGIEDGIRVWLEKIAEVYGVQPIIYSALPFVKTVWAEGFSMYPLWIADDTRSTPAPPGDSETWTFWQYTQKGAIPGLNGDVDRDIYQGTEVGWRQLLIPEK